MAESKKEFSKYVGKDDVFRADRVTKKGKLGEGNVGIVHKVILKKGKHERSFALKTFKAFDPEDITADIAYERYRVAKEAGLKVLPTVRLNEETDQLLTTLIDPEKYTVVPKDFKGQAEEIENLDELIADIKKNVDIANEKSVFLPADSYLFFVKNGGPSQIEFYFGDFDLITDMSHKSKGELKIKNSEKAGAALNLLVERYIDDPAKKEESLKKIKNVFP